VRPQLVSYVDDDTALLARVRRQAALALHSIRALMTSVAALGVIATVSVIATDHFRAVAGDAFVFGRPNGIAVETGIVLIA
jgi:hypothetical protein